MRVELPSCPRTSNVAILVREKENNERIRTDAKTMGKVDPAGQHDDNAFYLFFQKQKRAYGHQNTGKT
jgi:hypothetical protein